MIQNVRELYQYRALLWALTMRELKSRYRNSALGFLWTFLNPTLNMLVYVLVFGTFMKSDQKAFPYYLFCGLLPWIYFSTSVIAGTAAVSERKDLLTKVRFPAQVLPATIVTTNLVNFVLSMPLLFALGLLYSDLPSWHLIFALPVLAIQTLFTLALTYVLSALNVAFRDLQHIVGNLVQLWFFLTPVVWPIKNLSADQKSLMLYGNPVASIILAWRQIFFEHVTPDWAPLAVVAVEATVLLWFAAGVFERRREEFAELV
jgi:lipopolysaccharide transport system permease protein